MSQDTISLNVTKREVLGKQVRGLRTTGVVPAVIHDHGKQSLHVQADYMETYKVFQKAGKHHPVEVTADGKKFMTMIKDADFEPKKHTLRHIVFNAVKANQTVDAEVPIHPQYAEGDESSPAERNSLLVISNIDVVTVKALPANLPDTLFYDANKLVEVGDSVSIADLIVPKDVEIVADETQTVATVYEPSAIAAANDDAGGDAEPGDEQAIESDVTPEDVTEPEGDEQRPGGRKEFEDHDQGTNPEKQ